MRKLLLILGVLVALPCAHIMGQDTLTIKELGVYLKFEDPEPPIPPIPPLTDSTVIIDNAVKGIQGYQHNYTAGWTDGTNNAPWYAGTLTYTTTGSVTMRFNSKKVYWYTERGPTHGKVQVLIDSVVKATIDLYAPAFKQQVLVWSDTTLTQDIHTITLKATNTKNPASSGTYALHDYFKFKNPEFVPDITEPPVPLPPDADVVVNPGGNIQGALSSAASGTTVGLVEGNYTANILNVPVGVSLVGAGKAKTIITFTGSHPQQSETGMVQLKGGTTTMSVSYRGIGAGILVIVLVLWLIRFILEHVNRERRLWSIILVVVFGLAILFVLLQPRATTTAAGNQTVSGFTIKGNFQCNGGVIVDGRDNVKILDVKVQETTYFGAWLKNTSGSEFANNELLNSSWASVGWVTGELDVFNITNTIIHHNFIKTTRTDKGYGIKALWPNGIVRNSKFYNNRFELVHTSMWNNGSAPNIDIELHDTSYDGIEFYENDFSTMGLSLAGHKPAIGNSRTIVRNNRFTWSSTAAIEVVCHNITIENNVFNGSPIMTANFAANGRYTGIVVNNNTFNSSGTNPSWGALHLIGADGMEITITNNKYTNTRGYPLVKHMGPPGNSVVVQSGNVIN